MTTPGRYFYSVAATLVAVISFIGFHPFYLAGEGMAGRRIRAEMFSLVLVHGALLTLWVILFSFWPESRSASDRRSIGR